MNPESRRVPYCQKLAAQCDGHHQLQAQTHTILWGPFLQTVRCVMNTVLPQSEVVSTTQSPQSLVRLLAR